MYDIRAKCYPSAVRDSGLRPKLHLFVCGNRRDDASPLGTGCAERGDALYEELKREVAARGAYTRVWVTKTHCLGVCPKTGATVAIYPSGRIVADVLLGDAPGLCALFGGV